METIVEVEGFDKHGTTDFRLSLEDQAGHELVSDGIRIKNKAGDDSVLLSRSELIEAINYLEKENQPEEGGRF